MKTRSIKFLTYLIMFFLFIGLEACSKKPEEEKLPSKFITPKRQSRTSNPVSTLVNWIDFNEASEKAKKDKKAIFINFYAVWCGYCRKMDQEVFADQEVAKKLKNNFYSVKINTGIGDDVINYKNHKISSQGFAMMMGARGLPTSIFLDHKGEIITTLPGYLSKDNFLPILDYVNDKCYSKNISLDQYLSGKTKCN